MNLCKIEGCEKKTVARGFCHSHYTKALKAGEFKPQHGSRTLKWIEQHKNYTGDDCLIWPFARTKAGYPNMKHGETYRVASRVMCEIAHGKPDDESLHAAHSCGNGRGGCMNPNHLRWATPKENEADKEIHGTRARGEDCSFSKLTWAIVDAIREDAKTMRNKDIAEKHNITRQTVSSITLNQAWVRR